MPSAPTGCGHRAFEWDLFPKSRQPFSDDLFQYPGAEYRGAPFWSWNNKLDVTQLMRQIGSFQEMGFGGFNMHTRVGLDTPYLDADFMEVVKECVDRWPSGFAGGKVTDRDENFRSQHLLFTPWAYGDPECPSMDGAARSNSAEARRSELGSLMARYSIVLDDDGYLVHYKRLTDDEQAERVWYAYRETNPPSEWFNGGHYVDTLNKVAMQRFMDVTYESYRQAVGTDFGDTIPAIFTDEPQFAMKTQLTSAHARQDVFMPWTTDLEDTYSAKYGESLLDSLPELIWDTKRPSKTRYRFHDHVCDRFVEAFIDQLGDWCGAHGIALTGHMMYEERLKTQTGSLGEAMRCYRNMHLPGIDMLCDMRDFTVAKQAQSVSRQYGRCGVLSELYGVTNWTFTFTGHKGQGDWQAALGVNVRVPHLAWVTMAGEAKRDYPAAIGYQSPWHKEYPFIENHFARVGYAMSRGTAVVRVAVIHPIESYWLAYGPSETSPDQETMEEDFRNLTNWLCHGLIDFDFISEALLPQLDPHVAQQKLHVGRGVYEAILLPNLTTIRSTTVKILSDFNRDGGAVIVAGSEPTLVDVEPSGAFHQAIKPIHTQFSKHAILQTLNRFRDIRVTGKSGKPADSLLYQIRADGDERYVFLCNTDRVRPCATVVDIRGQWNVEVLDTLSRKHSRLESRIHRDTWTRFEHHFDGCGSLLLRLSHKASALSLQLPLQEQAHWLVAEEVTPSKVSLSEPNVLLLDIARYRVDEEIEWSPPEEILRQDNVVRARLRMTLRKDDISQPYRKARRAAEHVLHLRYEFMVGPEVSVQDAQLALEGAKHTIIKLDGDNVASNVTGWWVDEAIETVALPEFGPGRHVLELSMPFDELTNVERVYILGNFGVDLRGRHTTLVKLDLEGLRVGDYTRQGLPFYAGNVHYHFDIHGKDRTAVHVPPFGAPVLGVDVDHTHVGVIALPPYTLDLGRLSPTQQYRLCITAYGDRNNAFGALHLPNGKTKWYGPDAWRTQGDSWTYEYNIRDMGLFTAPRILTTNRSFANPNWDVGSVESLEHEY